MSTLLQPEDEQNDTSSLLEIARALQGLRFGAVEITVHNGQVVQIERKEKMRLPTASSRQA